MFARDLAAAFAAAATKYAREHHDVNSLAASLPFAATRASDNGVLHPHRAALADSLYEAGRDDEAHIAADPTKHIEVAHYGPEVGWGVEEWRNASYGLGHAVHSYLNTALWTGDDGSGEPLDTRYSHHDFSEESQHKARHAVHTFLGMLSQGARDEAESRLQDVGHDLWLSRNGHGSGFWDHDYEHLDELHEAAKSLGEQYVEVDPQPNGDATDSDGVQLHLHGGRE